MTRPGTRGLPLAYLIVESFHLVGLALPRRFKRVFGIEIEGCARCGGKLKVIASIEEPEVIAKILAHLERTAPAQYQAELPLGARAPPEQARLI